MVCCIAHVLIEPWRSITLEPITYLIVSIYHTIRLTELNKNNYIARLVKNRFKSYGPLKFNKAMGQLSMLYCIAIKKVILGQTKKQIYTEKLW